MKNDAAIVQGSNIHMKTVTQLHEGKAFHKDAMLF
jgi:hypothetical protein